MAELLCLGLRSITTTAGEFELAIMKFPHDAIRLARKRRERLFPFLCFRISPFCPDSRYPEELAIENFDLVFRFRSLLGVFPFKE